MSESGDIDYLSRAGSAVLVQRLRRRWGELGLSPSVWVQEESLWRDRSFFSIRSSLKLELPQCEKASDGG